MSRCSTCKYSKCPANDKCIDKCIENDCVLFDKTHCICVAYRFDRQENCPKYEQNTEEQNGTGKV